tara:strand:- start:25 stop:294 length:270 start_codon:yes stop_codon:yes gene_type:complete
MNILRKCSRVVIAVAILGTTMPAWANASGDSYDVLDDNSSTIISVLREQGIDATAVEDWGDQVRAFVRLKDGSEVMQYFDLDTLPPVKR